MQKRWRRRKKRIQRTCCQTKLFLCCQTKLSAKKQRLRIGLSLDNVMCILKVGTCVLKIFFIGMWVAYNSFSESLVKRSLGCHLLLSVVSPHDLLLVIVSVRSLYSGSNPTCLPGPSLLTPFLATPPTLLWCPPRFHPRSTPLHSRHYRNS